MARLAAAVVIALVLLAPVVQAQPTGIPSGGIDVEGATYAEFDERTGTLTLRGMPVTIRRGTMRLRAPSVVYETKPRIIQASGGVEYSGPLLALEAPRVTVWVDQERLVAEEGVRGTRGEGTEAISLRAARLEVFGREGRAVATGSVEMSAPDVTVTGDRIEAAEAPDELVAEGNARIVREDIEGRAPRVRVRRGEGTAVLSGGAVVRQGLNEARADTITVDLRRRRFTAAGRASLVLHPSR